MSYTHLITRRIPYGLAAVLAGILLTGFISGTAWSTVKSHVFPAMQHRKVALENAIIRGNIIIRARDLAPDAEGIIIPAGRQTSVTQDILVRAGLEYQATLSKGESEAMNRLLMYLKQCGVSQDLADRLIDEITSGHYQAADQVVYGLRILAQPQ